MFKKILLASDGSDQSLSAAIAAADIAKKYRSSLTILNVYSIPSDTAITASGMSVNGIYDAEAIDMKIKSASDEAVQATIDILKKAKVKAKVISQYGNPADVICRVSKEGNYDLIVMGHRGMGRIKSFLLGSVSYKVSKCAECAVLITK